MIFDPEDQNTYELGGPINTGPHCRNCHKGSTDCAICHSDWIGGASDEHIKYKGTLMRDMVAAGDPAALLWPRTIYTTDAAVAAAFPPATDPLSATDATVAASAALQQQLHANANGSHAFNMFYTMGYTWDDFYPGWKSTYLSGINTGAGGATNNREQMKWERTVDWSDDWRTTSAALGAADICSNDGFSWPHRTLGWKMLKDDLFGIDFDGDPIGVGATRAYADVANSKLDNHLTAYGADIIKPAHDIDSVCLDCHNPTIWGATAVSHRDASGTYDDKNDELMQRGLP